jgi:hypothetical protein
MYLILLLIVFFVNHFRFFAENSKKYPFGF